MEFDRYHRLKAINLCPYCGKRAPKLGHAYCEKCLEKQKKYKYDTSTKSIYNEVKEEKKKKPKKKPVYTTEEINKMAKERGISYGYMVALLEQGKV